MAALKILLAFAFVAAMMCTLVLASSAEVMTVLTISTPIVCGTSEDYTAFASTCYAVLVTTRATNTIYSATATSTRHVTVTMSPTQTITRTVSRVNAVLGSDSSPTAVSSPLCIDERGRQYSCVHSRLKSSNAAARLNNPFQNVIANF